MGTPMSPRSRHIKSTMATRRPGPRLHDPIPRLPKSSSKIGVILPGKGDRFDGFTIDLSSPAVAKIAPVKFRQLLNDSLAAWGAEGKRGIWCSCPESSGKLLPVLLEAGFAFHHAVPGHAMLSKWLPEDQENRLPLYPHHQLGAAGIILAGDKCLVIQEKTGVTAGRKDFWKLPGGLVDPGEVPTARPTSPVSPRPA